jgi:hypothetical protein
VFAGGVEYHLSKRTRRVARTTAITIKRDIMRLIWPPQGRLGVQSMDNECSKQRAPKRGRNHGVTRIRARTYHQDRRGLARGRVVRPPAGNDGCEGLGQGPQTRPERNLQGRTGQGISITMAQLRLITGRNEAKRNEADMSAVGRWETKSFRGKQGRRQSGPIPSE